MSGIWKIETFLVAAVSTVLLAADNPAWKDREIAQWSEDDAKQVLADSPWAKMVAPTINPRTRNDQSAGTGRRSGGFGIPGIGFPGGGGGRRGGGLGYPGGGGGGYPGGGRRTSGGDADDSKPVNLTVRWESAFPVREAELKVRDSDAPTLDEEHYAVAVYGVPSRMIGGDPSSMAGQFKKEATIQRDGKKNLKPSKVEVLQREDGVLVVYLFPKSAEISKNDARVQFNAKIGRLEFTQSFYTADMIYQGKLEL